MCLFWNLITKSLLASFERTCVLGDGHPRFKYGHPFTQANSFPYKWVNPFRLGRNF